jgi:meiotic recombination protein REC8
MNSSIPITGSATIPIGPNSISNVPNIAYSIPDFEGSATLRIFSNATQTQIGCFQAVMRNGHSFSHPAAVGSVLGVFTAVALAASFATAVYGVSVSEIRTHYAHSLSMLVVFEVFQSIFFSGALSLSWPSVLPAFWSNFAWASGQIRASTVIHSINSFVGVSGNSSQVGGAGSVDLNNAGGLETQIYGRSIDGPSEISFNQIIQRVTSSIYKRVAKESSSQFSSNRWAGSPISPGLPLPGTIDGFVGVLAKVGVPAADAFLNGFLWFMILIVILIMAVVLFKWSLEFLVRAKMIKEDRFMLFRNYWLGFMGVIILRSMLIAFFMMMTLTLFQFSSGGKGGVLAIATIVFVIFFGGIFGTAFYACYSRLRLGKYTSEADRIHFQPKSVMKVIPWFKTVRQSSLVNDNKKTKSAGSVSFPRLHFVNNDPDSKSIHEDEGYIKRFGWLSSRFRRSRWWFTAVWVIYQFVRACFIGGARGDPAAQVFGLLIWEIIAFVAIIMINPFESARNTALAVYMLGVSKVTTTGLSIAFLPQFKVARIPATAIGIVIIVIQGLLVIGLMILIALGAISTYMSVTRNREHVRPRDLETLRVKYFGIMDRKATDLPPPPPPPPESIKEPYFNVLAVRRAPKIEDEDVVPDIPDVPHQGSDPQPSVANRASRAGSVGSYSSTYGSVPFGARVHRASWSSRDFQIWQEERVPSPLSPASRRTSSHNLANSSLSDPHVFKAVPSQSSLRLSTPVADQPVADQPEKRTRRSVAFADSE